MPIKVRCPSCKDAFSTSSKNRGRRVECPVCSATIRVSKRSKKGRRGGSGPRLAIDDLSDEAIAAVLADGDEPPREYVPRVEQSDEGSSETARAPAVANGAPPHGRHAKGSPLATTLGDSDDGVPSEGLDAVEAVLVADRSAKPMLSADSLKASTLPFALGGIVGGAVASVVWWFASAAAPPPPAPQPTRNAAPAVESRPSGPPPETPEEVQEALGMLAVVSIRLETGGGLLGGGRSLIATIRNDTGFVLRSATLDVEVGLAAFDDAVLAEERVVAPFSPSLGLGEQQEIRITPPGGGPIAAAKVDRPVRVTAKVVDIDWQGRQED